MRTRFQILTIIIFSINIFSQHWPLANAGMNNVTSAYGPRNLATGAEYPNENYDYDFHGGIDIAKPEGTNVFFFDDGTIIAHEGLYSSGEYIIVEHDKSDPVYYTQYYHIRMDDNLWVGKEVHWEDIAGTIRDFESDNNPYNDHLDFRVYAEDPNQTGGYFTTVNPTEFLLPNASATSVPVPIDRNGYIIYQNNYLESRHEPITNGNPDNHFFEIGMRVDKDELDFSEIEFFFTASNWNGSEYIDYDQTDILDDTNVPSGHPNIIKIDYPMENCGDINGNNSDNGFNVSSSVGIVPRKLGDDYQIVYYRFYLKKGSEWITELSDASITLFFADWLYKYDTSTYSDNGVLLDLIPVYTTIGDPPAGSPGAPNLTSAAYLPTTNTVKLNWLSSGPESILFRIYRCDANQAINDGDIIGITTNYEYIDDDNILTLGTSYRYAVAGVNSVGEGPNSNERIVLFAQPSLSLTITGPSFLLWKQSGTFLVSATNGVAPYLFHWFKKMDGSTVWSDLYIGTTKTIFGDRTKGFTLKVIGTDNNGMTGEDSHYVAGGLYLNESGEISKYEESLLPEKYSLENYPNPFNPSTTIKFGLPEGQNVSIDIYNTIGEKVKTLLNESRGPGFHEVEWNGKDSSGRSVSSGMYLYVLKTNSEKIVKKMFFMK